MPDAPVISVDHVSKAYRIWESPARRLISPGYAAAAALAPGRLGERLREKSREGYRDFYALRDISFEVRRGEAVGIIGRNGSGKSTLLQIIAGTLQPSAGSVSVQGRVAALLELGSGFNPEFTGRENVYLNGTVMGFSRNDIDARFDQIASFADIGDFIEQPVKTYSSGMMVRLAFALQTAIEPEIFIVDEALSVGDFFFQQKCFKRIAELRANGTTLLFVSHNMASVRDLCHRALYLKAGRAVEFGESQHTISLYLREDPTTPAVSPVAATAPAAPVPPAERFQEICDQALWVNPAGPSAEVTGPGRIEAVRLLDARRVPGTAFKLGQPAFIQAYVRVHESAALHFAVELKNRQGQVVSCIGSRTVGLPAVEAAAGQILEFEAAIELGLEAGEYSLQAVLGLPDTRPNIGTRVHATPWLGPVTISWNYELEPAPFLGMFHLPNQIKFAAWPATPTPPS
jgi:lipopolysaccharide transport system ATP-binding protein